ncbi:death domain associated protein [Wolffia australiana]
MAALQPTLLSSAECRRISASRSRLAGRQSPSKSLHRSLALPLSPLSRRRGGYAGRLSVGNEEAVEVDAQTLEASPEDLEYISQIKNVLKLLKKNRDMLFGEVKLTIMIEDPRDVERKRLLGIDVDEVTREDLVAALEDVNQGRIPNDRLALRLLAEEMTQWPNLEVEINKKGSRKSLYAKATDTGIDPKEAARRLNIDWDSAAAVESDDEEEEDPPVPPVVGYGALYLVTGLPIIIGVSVVLILFYNSLQ